MAQNITISAKKMVAEANSEITTISIEEASKLISSPDHVIIDLRDIRELQRSGKIPGAFSCPRGMLEFWIDPASPYHKEIFNQDKTYVFYCASAWRSALSAKLAQDMGLAPVAHIAGGFTAWIKAELPIENLPK
ncbi:MAG: rhodanese-like domain-containing protein [Planktomarina sp.]|nr:rhodanese-like domain-containing protein [Planktomarina sp.]MDT2056607.1 rhodanese-like domain-containing protein [Planktomarina sp.]MDT2072031.1 rhodanese-like domain-containing protein [Planktomarina sp.]MDT2076930.1 rhodanese-like domain-containing protein [Planktomarina sp.]HAJ84656.1 rhodanese [Paracoccaceae bacterium]